MNAKSPSPDRFHLLLVEDNPINQQVALGILKNLGYRADLVADGRRAVEALTQSAYDLVLMDCQLPEMDGYEATRRIRRPETPVLNHDIPIVALTAHAMAGDREKCLAAGMDDYLSKPIRTALLAETLERWLARDVHGVSVHGVGAHGQAPEPSTPPPLAAPQPSEGVVLDLGELVERLMGDEDRARRILAHFVEDMPGQIAALAHAVENADAATARLKAHSIKGAAANVGGVEIRNIALRLEQSGTAGDLATMAAVLPDLAASFDRLVAQANL